MNTASNAIFFLPIKFVFNFLNRNNDIRDKMTIFLLFSLLLLLCPYLAAQEETVSPQPEVQVITNTEGNVPSEDNTEGLSENNLNTTDSTDADKISCDKENLRESGISPESNINTTNTIKVIVSLPEDIITSGHENNRDNLEKWLNPKVTPFSVFFKISWIIVLIIIVVVFLFCSEKNREWIINILKHFKYRLIIFFEEKRNNGKKKTLTIKGIIFVFRWCPAGSFWMGNRKEKEERKAEIPLHRVTISRGFWMQETPVTQKMWLNIMGNNPSKFKGGNRPVENVSWNDCQRFIEKLNRDIGIPAGYKASLPTEAQWEYACRAGTETRYSFGDTLEKQANYGQEIDSNGSEAENNLKRTTEVKEFPANPWGLFDMHGNVSEWCSDWYNEDYYEYSPENDPEGPEEGSIRVVRGGGWGCGAWCCRSAFRNGYDPTIRGNNFGFRLTLVPSK